MKMKYLATLIAIAPMLAVAEENNTWVDKKHTSISDTLDEWANDINNWLGETDPNDPASASLRVMMDSQWNRHDKFTFKPRVRGKIKLPVLKKHLNVVFGDDELDNEIRDKTHTRGLYRDIERNKHYNSREARDSNASIALRWSDNIKALGIETDLDGGIRSGDDVFGRLRISKDWDITERFNTRLEQIYRYGSNSKHYLRTNLENKYNETETTFIMNHTHFEYRHDLDEERSWGHSLYRQHNFKELSRISYGLSVGGRLDSNLSKLNHWGPFVNYRQPIWRKWLFIQPEISFYNDRDKDRSHYINTYVRLEAIF